MTITLSALQKQRYDTAANWTAENPTLLAGEIGVESDTGKIKIGTGSTAWTSLSYSGLIPGSGVYPYSQLLMPLGSAGAPSVSFTGDPNTGIYSPGADQVAISTNGTGRLFVDASGNVGVGASPTSLFSVRGNTPAINIDDELNTSSKLVFRPAVLGYAERAGFSLNYSTGEFRQFSGASAAGYFQTFYTDGSERLRITSAGLVGIGSSSPSFPLHVSSTDFPAIGVFRALNVGVVGDAGQEIQIGALSGSTPTPGAAITGVLESSATAGNLGFKTRSGGVLGERLRITSAGLVGIGSSAPQGLLHLQQSLSDSTPVLAIGEASNTVRYSIIQESGYTGISHGNTNIDLKFKTFANGGSGGTISFWTGVLSASEKARIDSSGRLLVGASSDSGGALLQVNGDRIRVATAKTPASATAAGTAGEICWDASYIYVCTATNTWKRTAISTW
jgi:hypothetical protein